MDTKGWDSREARRATSNLTLLKHDYLALHNRFIHVVQKAFNSTSKHCLCCHCTVTDGALCGEPPETTWTSTPYTNSKKEAQKAARIAHHCPKEVALHLGLDAVGRDIYNKLVCSVCQEVRQVITCAEAAEEAASLLKVSPKVSLVSLLLPELLHLFTKNLHSMQNGLVCPTNTACLI